MPGKQRAPTQPKRRSTSSTTKLKPSLLSMKPPAGGKGKRGAQKAKDADAREKLDAGRNELREALQASNKPLVERKEKPVELAKGGDSLAKSMDEVLDLFGAA
ncbi:hypothetical protein OF846_002837 [Rhodotorula toruloides]|nr:hypothetical protein OF846_002837 [Rhodotorula toruloides]